MLKFIDLNLFYIATNQNITVENIVLFNNLVNKAGFFFSKKFLRFIIL